MSTTSANIYKQTNAWSETDGKPKYRTLKRDTLEVALLLESTGFLSTKMSTANKRVRINCSTSVFLSASAVKNDQWECQQGKMIQDSVFGTENIFKACTKGRHNR